MPASFSFEALKAQAVASRTFAYNKINNSLLDYDNLSKDKGQAYIDQDEMKEKWGKNYKDNYEKVSKAVLDTKGEIILYENAPISAYYFSSSNGKTEESKNVFGEKPYLLSVESPWDETSKEYKKVITISKKQFKEKLNINEKEEININNEVRNKSNRIVSIDINGKTYKGIDLRKKFELRSTDFKIKINENDIEIITNGYGHGVGMSQYGANYLATDGKNYEEIIKYYYTGVSIGKI